MTRELKVTAETDDRLALKMAWLEGDDPNTGVKFDLTTGVGLGSPWLTLLVEMPDGAKVRETVDIRKLVTEWVSQIITERS